MDIKIKPEVIVEDYSVGVIVARMQVHELHEAHLELLKIVSENHKKVIIFLGVPRITNTQNNPLGFSERAFMIKEVAENAIIVPIQDRRNNDEWSKELDTQIALIHSGKALLYGGRDSFIPYYTGKNTTVELVSDVIYSGAFTRKTVAEEVLSSSDFRAGVIYSCFQNRPTSFQTVDIAVVRKEQILLGKKPGENDMWRFIGGFVDPTDDTLEAAAKRELHEEAGAIEVSDPKYIGSFRVDDWRYRKEKSKILTSLFICEYVYGNIEPNDDIEAVGWFDINEVGNKIELMSEHVPLFNKLRVYIDGN